MRDQRVGCTDHPRLPHHRTACTRLQFLKDSWLHHLSLDTTATPSCASVERLRGRLGGVCRVFAVIFVTIMRLVFQLTVNHVRGSPWTTVGCAKKAAGTALKDKTVRITRTKKRA